MPEESPETAFERRIVSVLFADLVGFTSLSEQLDPEDVATVQDAYFASVRDTVARHGGVLEKFIGDAAMAVFGIPKARDDDAERAIRAGLALIGAVEALGARLGLAAGEDGDAGLRLRVGVNTGEVVSAESGPDTGRVTGDTVNLAARFQAAAHPGTVLVGELTQLSAAEAVEFEAMGGLDLKGKAEPVPAWRVTGLRLERSREEALGALRAPLLGRAAELERLESALSAAGDSASAESIVIVAPPGVGKSRLLAEFASRAEDARAQVMRARARTDVLGPAEPVGQLLRGALRAVDAATREAAVGALSGALAATGASPGRIEVVTGEVLDTLWPPPASLPTATPDRDARFGAWLEALDALAGHRPSVWLVEDIHWAGGDLLAFLALAGTWPSGGGRVVIATARPSVLEQLAEGTTVLELPPLPALEAGELVRALVGDALPEEVVAAIAERSDGNPLFIEELLRSWISSGTLVADADTWRLAVAPSAVPLPATVQAIYAAQLDDLPAPARLVARRASVAGRRFAVRALEPLEIPDPAEGLDRLSQRAFLRGPEIDQAGDEIYTYRHALLRDAGYASLSRAERGRLHLALAAWLEQTAGTDTARVAEPIASHYESALAALPAVSADPDERARLTDAARSWLERAADAALVVAAHDAALGLLARALNLVPSDSLEAGRLRLRRGELLAVAGNMDDGIGEMEAAVQLAQSHFRSSTTADERAAARAIYGAAMAGLGAALIEQIRFIEARDAVASVLEEIAPPDDQVTARLMALRAFANTEQGDREGTVPEVDRAWDIVRGTDPQIELEVLLRRASVRSESFVFPWRDWLQLEEMARQNEQWAIASRALLMAAGNAGDELPPHEVLAMHVQNEEMASAHGLTEQAGWARYAQADQLMRLGDWDEATAVAMACIDEGERNSYGRLVFRTWMVISVVLTARGDVERMARFAAWFDRNRTTFPDPPSAYAKVLMTATNLRLGTLGLAPLVDWEITPAVVGTEAYSNADYLDALEGVIGAWIRQGEVSLAAEACRLVSATYLTAANWATSHLEWASFSLTAAWVAKKRGETDQATAHAREALEQARAAQTPWWVVRAIRALPEGAATADELAEADEIEGRLGVTSAATAPPV